MCGSRRVIYLSYILKLFSSVSCTDVGAHYYWLMDMVSSSRIKELGYFVYSALPFERILRFHQ